LFVIKEAEDSFNEKCQEYRSNNTKKKEKIDEEKLEPVVVEKNFP
jgi:hypothetical protein